MSSDPRILCVGDLHVHVTNLEETQLLTENILTIAVETRPDLIVVLGDILDTNNVVRTEALGLAVDLLGRLSEVAPLLVLVGNHDVPGPLVFLSKTHAFSFLKRWTGTKTPAVVFPSGTGVQLVDSTPVAFYVGDKKFCACPYVPPERFREALSLCEGWQDSTAIFCHQEILGCDLGQGYESKVTDNWTKEDPVLISGHIHRHQTLLDGNVLYVGSARQVVISEDYYKTISLITFGSGVIEQRFSTGLPPRAHFKVFARDVDSLDLPESGRVKIEITGTVPENAVLKKSQLVKDWKKRGFTVKFHDLLDDGFEFDETEVETGSRPDFKGLCRELAEEEDLFDEYVEVFG
jgi:DNA repair exonuclease SbcCD nuclease subunit